MSCPCGRTVSTLPEGLRLVVKLCENVKSHSGKCNAPVCNWCCSNIDIEKNGEIFQVVLCHDCSGISDYKEIVNKLKTEKIFNKVFTADIVGIIIDLVYFNYENVLTKLSVNFIEFSGVYDEYAI